MEFINMEYLNQIRNDVKQRFNNQKPFRFVTFDGIFYPEAAEKIHDGYPKVQEGVWNGTTYIHQKNKFQKTKFEAGSLFDRAFHELNSREFLNWLEDVTQIKGLEEDPKLFGGGLHQSITGAFLNVHVDYNYHPETNHHRRLNVIVYMNKDWKDEYEGHIELWDMEKKEQLARIAPTFNRCVIFETNEISYHGHPIPLKTPEGVSRKSLATYYFTETRPEHEIAQDHNTIYVNTTGVGGQVKILKSGFRALIERIFK